MDDPCWRLEWLSLAGLLEVLVACGQVRRLLGGLTLADLVGPSHILVGHRMVLTANHYRLVVELATIVDNLVTAGELLGRFGVGIPRW